MSDTTGEVSERGRTSLFGAREGSTSSQSPTGDSLRNWRAANFRPPSSQKPPNPAPILPVSVAVLLLQPQLLGQRRNHEHHRSISRLTIFRAVGRMPSAGSCSTMGARRKHYFSSFKKKTQTKASRAPRVWICVSAQDPVIRFSCSINTTESFGCWFPNRAGSG